MKIKPEIYAQILVNSLEDKTIPREDIAKNFWYTLQKNGQYKELSNILAKAEEEYAKKNGAILVDVFSAEALDETMAADVKQRLTKHFNQDVIMRQIVKPNSIAGIIIKMGDREIDLSLEGKMNNLKQLLK